MDKTNSTHKLGSNLSEIFEKRQQRSEETDVDCALRMEQNIQNSVDLSRMLSIKEKREYKKIFTRFDRDSDGFLDLEDMKRMMETLGAPQTHLSLKEMIREVDSDGDNKISFNEFLLIYMKAKAGELQEDSGLSALAKITEIDVSAEGVVGAKSFFESKIEQLKSQSKFEEEIKKEQEEKKREQEEIKRKRQEFLKKQCYFEQATLTN